MNILMRNYISLSQARYVRFCCKPDMQGSCKNLMYGFTGSSYIASLHVTNRHSSPFSHCWSYIIIIVIIIIESHTSLQERKQRSSSSTMSLELLEIAHTCSVMVVSLLASSSFKMLAVAANFPAMTTMVVKATNISMIAISTQFGVRTTIFSRVISVYIHFCAN